MLLTEAFAFFFEINIILSNMVNTIVLTNYEINIHFSKIK